jgi:hypothetical protein
MIGNNLPVMAYIEPAVFLKIEATRGDIPRSTFLGKMIKKKLEEAN